MNEPTMKRLIIGNLAIVMAVLYPMTAFAECAWILWVEKETVVTEKRDTRGHTEWTIRDTFTTLPACQEGQERYWKKGIDDSKKTGFKVTSQPYLVTESFTSSETGAYWSIMYIFKCVPDTLDPRPTR